jgi:hypothetical protein
MTLSSQARASTPSGRGELGGVGVGEAQLLVDQRHAQAEVDGERERVGVV